MGHVLSEDTKHLDYQTPQAVFESGIINQQKIAL